MRNTPRKDQPLCDAPLPEVTDGWQVVQFSTHCDPDGDGWCYTRDCDPAECDCLGPTQEGVEYQEVAGVLYGRLLDE
jgi:hypothetical protein